MLKNYSVGPGSGAGIKIIKSGIRIAILFFIIMPFSLPCAKAQETESFFTSGNLEYEKGNYPGAIADYEKARLTGKISSALYYNLAGAYLKSGDIGRAVLNYERAINLSPRDADIAANYGFAKSLVTGKEPNPRGFSSWRPIRIYNRFLTVNEMTIITSVLFFLFFIFLGLSVVLGSSKVKASLAAIVLGALVIFSSFLVFQKVKEQNSYAVIVVPSTDAFFGPFDSATKFFTLHEGNSVMILETKDSWHRVRRQDGMVGWVKNMDLERL